MISPAWVRSSSPTITRHGSRPASSSAPRMALWSVMHSTSRPDSTTACSSSSGVVVESPDHIVWLCRSTRTQPGTPVGGQVRVAVDGGGVRTHSQARYRSAARRCVAERAQPTYQPARSTMRSVAANERKQTRPSGGSFTTAKLAAATCPAR